MAKKKKNQSKNKDDTHKKPKKSILSINHFIVVIVTLILSYLLLESSAGYRHLKNSFVLNNLKFIMNMPTLSYDQKMRAKFSKDYPFIEFIEKHTPDSAVILMPPRSHESVLHSTNGAQNKLWCVHFLYPRKFVYVDEKENPLQNQITHVMIVNEWGYDYLESKYGMTFPKKVPYTVVPIPQENN